jgi:ferredoxin-thioredoxin reductase catalytic chain
MSDRPTPEKVEELYARLASNAAAGSYHLNPDEEFTRDIIEALLTNTQRYGYQSCPCRLAGGVRNEDLDIICPCDYRDPDLAEFGSCYCALYVSGEIARGEKEAVPIPERRNKPSERARGREGEGAKKIDAEKELAYPVWRCPVCGYLCAREHPPEKCPICKADGDRFNRFL